MRLLDQLLKYHRRRGPVLRGVDIEITRLSFQLTVQYGPGASGEEVPLRKAAQRFLLFCFPPASWSFGWSTLTTVPRGFGDALDIFLDC